MIYGNVRVIAQRVLPISKLERQGKAMVQIITDSAADLEPHEYEKMNITCIPLCVNFGDTEYEENINLSKSMFYRLLEQSDDFPRTSQPSPYSVKCMLEKTTDMGDEVVIITLSSGFSGLYQNVLMVKNMLGYEGCYVIDSLTGTGGQRILVEQAVRPRDEGKCAAEIAAEIEELRSRLVLYACIDTLEYLRRGGRISKIAYTIGTLANVKQIITVNKNGQIEIPAKTRGMRNGMAFLCSQIENKPPDTKYPLYVMFTGNRTNGELLAKRLCDLGYAVSNEHIINVGAAIGSHIGPNACGLVYAASEKN